MALQPRRWRPGAALIAAAALSVAAVFLAADAPARPMGTWAGAAVLRATAALAAASPPAQAGPIVGGLSSTSVGILVVDGGRHQCTASMVASRSRRLLATAAHCVWLDGRWQLDGAFFVPGYASGEEPQGRWPVDQAWIPVAWQRANTPVDDVAAQTDFAFVSLRAVNGDLPEDVLGAQGVAWDAVGRLDVAALGYPSLPPYDGQSLRGCVGTAQAKPFHPASAPTSADDGRVRVLDCDMTEGASGGPWLIGPDAARGRGQIAGVISGGDDTSLVSPLFGTEAEQLYRTADLARPGDEAAG